MHKMYVRLLLAALIVTCFATGFDGDSKRRAAVRQTMLHDLANRVIQPLHEDFAQEAAALEEAARVFASAPSEETLATAQAAWTRAALSWRRLSALNIPGPVRSGIYHFRINTWPANVTTIEEAIATAEEINEKLVDSLGSNARGLPALEYLYFAGGDEDVLQKMRTDAKRGAYAHAVAQNVNTKSSELLNAWSRDGKDQLGIFERANLDGSSLQSSLSRIVNEMANVMERMRHDKLGAPMGIASSPEEPAAEPDPNLVESPYAELSIQLMQAELSGLRMLMTAGNGTGLDDYLATFNATYDDVPLGEVIVKQIDHLEQMMANQDTPLKTQVATNPQGLMPLYEASKQLIRHLKTDLATWLSVNITFNDNDGD